MRELFPKLGSRVKVEADVLGSPSIIVRTVSVGVKQHWSIASELRSCVKVEVAVLGPSTETVRTIRDGEPGTGRGPQ